MGLPVTVYRHTDAGAPQLTNGTPSEWINILKKVLVEGYGAKAPLDWTLEFENAGQYKVAFRNKVADGGSGGYFQFWSSTGGNASNAPMNFQCAQSMSALDSFTRPGYGRQIGTVNAGRGWEVIGTSRGFYIINHQTSTLTNAYTTTTFQDFFIGDIWSSIAGDNNVFTIVSSIVSGDTYSVASRGISYGNSTLYCRLYAADGGGSSHNYTSLKNADYNATTLDGNAELLGIDHVMTQMIIYGSQTVTDSNGVVQNNSLVMPYCRGVIPGLHMSSFAGYRNENWPKELVVDDIVWVLLRSYWYTGLWIKTGEWYD